MPDAVPPPSPAAGPAVATVSSERVTIEGLAVAVTRPAVATRPPILFVHGIMAGAWCFAKYQRFFAERGHPTYAVDLRGRAGSRAVADPGRVSMRDYLDDAHAVARALGRPAVVGHSMGGLIAQKLAEADAVRAAVLVCAAPPRGILVASPSLLRRQLRYLWPMLRSRPLVGRRADNDAITFNRVPEVERAALHDRLLPESGRVGRELSLGAIAVDERRVRCPVLVVSGDDDRFVAPRIARQLARKYGATHREFAGHAHFMLWEPGWETPAAEIARWLAEVA